ncbi:MAG: type II secretion system protein, partial [Planctomycetota bacterium]|nr:type II secretion system protein [Planctomycetota bacterium]
MLNFSQLSIPAPARRAFSLLELMVVIVILGLLTAIALPIMGSLESQGRAVEELSGARAAVAAWRDYAVDRDGELLKGYYPDSEPSEDPLYDFNGNMIMDGEPQQRWFWRLSPYLENPKKTFFPKSLEVVRRELIDVEDHQYAATLHPAFGLNGEWIGGQGEDLSNALYALYEYGNLSRCPWMRSLSDVRNTSKLMVFASSRFGSTQGGAPGTWLPGIVQGFHRIESPCHPSNGYRWATGDNGSP